MYEVIFLQQSPIKYFIYFRENKIEIRQKKINFYFFMVLGS